MSALAPWEDAPLDPGFPPIGGSAVVDNRALTIRPRQTGAPPVPMAQPSPVQGAGSADAPWESAPLDPSANDGRSWLDTAKDVAQSAATGIEKGAIGLVTAPVVIEQGAHWLYNKASNAVLGPAPDQPAPVPGSLQDVAQNTGDYVGAGGVMRGIEALPGSGPAYQPQTTVGRYAETVGEFVPGGTGGGLSGFAKYALAPGLASEAAGQATQGTALEPYARGLAPILAGGGASLLGRPGAAGTVLRDAAGQVDAATLGDAQHLMDTAARQGSPLTLAEAVAHVSGGATMLPGLQRAVEQSAAGGPTMARFYAGRPGQVQAAGNAAIDRIGPAPSNPSAIGPAVQRAAESVVGDAHAARTVEVAPLYRAAATDTVPADAVYGILADIDQQLAADKTGLLAGPLGDLRSRLLDRTAPKGSQWERDPVGSVSTSEPPGLDFAPADTYEPPVRGMRPDVPRPQSLVSFLQSAGGVRDLGGDLKAAGLDRFPGLVRQSGGLSPDMARQAAAQAGYLGADLDHAMANTSTADLLDMLDRHPAYSVLDDDAVHRWETYDGHLDGRNRVSGPFARPAAPPRAPGLPEMEPGAAGTQPPAPITDIENLDRTRKYFRDRIDLPQFAPAAIDKETGARVGNVLGRLDDAMTAASPSFAEAKKLYQTVTRDSVDPIEQGMIGALSRSSEFGAQARIVLGENPLPGSATEVADAVKAISAKAPDAARALVSQRIRQVFNEATQNNMGGANQWGGAKFAALIQGNTQQARNVKAAVEALQGPGVWRDFQRTLDVFEAMGRRLAPGSPTEPLRQFNATLSKGTPLGSAIAAGASPGEWMSKASEIYRGWQYGRNSAELARMLTRPDAARVLAQIAKHPPGSSTAQGMAALYLLNNSTNQSGKAVAK